MGSREKAQKAAKRIQRLMDANRRQYLDHFNPLTLQLFIADPTFLTNALVLISYLISVPAVAFGGNGRSASSSPCRI
jgi:hypothetical protein